MEDNKLAQVVSELGRQGIKVDLIKKTILIPKKQYGIKTWSKIDYVRRLFATAGKTKGHTTLFKGPPSKRKRIVAQKSGHH